MPEILNKILKDKDIAYAIFDNNNRLKSKNFSIEKHLNLSSVNEGDDLFDLFPELFGYEDEIKKITNEKNNHIKLERINKNDSKQNIKYYDFYVTSIDNDIGNLLVVIYNSTNEAVLSQEIQQQKNEINLLKESLGSLKENSIDSILGESDKIKEVKNFIRKIGHIKSTTVLLTGESGIGKTLIARAIHNISSKEETPFVEINCASIPEALFESELFGHVKGAFTNAIDNKKGLIEIAEAGTLFLDEIGELPLSIQSKFLSFLESKKIRPVGSTKELSVNTRIICATNKDLKLAISNKEFREDLYYRINVASLKIPSLNERPEDILQLAKHFQRVFSIDIQKRITGFTERAEQKLLNYSWPGNIRELKNIIERAVIFSDGNLIEDADLVITEDDLTRKRSGVGEIPDNGVSLVEIEKLYIVNALKKTNGNQSSAAKLLNLSLDTLRYRMKKYKLYNSERR